MYSQSSKYSGGSRKEEAPIEDKRVGIGMDGSVSRATTESMDIRSNIASIRGRISEMKGKESEEKKGFRSKFEDEDALERKILELGIENEFPEHRDMIEKTQTRMEDEMRYITGANKQAIANMKELFDSKIK